MAKEKKQAGKRSRADDPNVIAAAEMARALNHPLRLAVFQSVAQADESATTLALRLKMPLGNVAYHLIKVLDEGFGFVEVAERRAGRRGTDESFFRIETESSLRSLQCLRGCIEGLERSIELRMNDTPEASA